MIIPPVLLELLRCPESGQRLAVASPEVLAALEARRREGTLGVASTSPQWDAAQPLDAVLVREDGQLGYPVQGGIPILLPGHGFELSKP
jgi:uncharacterized protein YbaR (Trm112 family)